MKILGAAVVLTAAMAAAGCSAVTVRPTDSPASAEQSRAGVLSAAARESLRILGLPEEDCQSAPLPCLQQMQPGQGLDEERRLSALAELWLAEAAAHESLDAWIEAARASYAYLFFTPRKPAERALEERQIQVRDFYNVATEWVATLLFEEVRRRGRLVEPPGDTILRSDSWTIHRGMVEVRLPGGEPPQELIAASRLRFGGLRNSYRRDGFGAALVAVAAEPAGRAAEAGASREARYVASSIVLRFPGSSLEEVMAAREATIDVYEPARHESLVLNGTEVPLAAQFTAPYALWLERSKFGLEAKRALLGRTERLVEPRVYLMQPWDPDRRTVVLIHGLASSPEAWVDLANELTGDEEIRRHCQIWEVFYNTGAPIAYNRYAILQALEETLDRFDPGRTAAASRDMVLVGHSLGGVLARLLVVSSGDRLWTGLLGHPPEDADRQKLAVLAPYLDLKPMPEVGRAVLLASPHRGAPMASQWIGRTLARLIRLPATLLGTLGQVADALSEDQPEIAARFRRGPDGIDGLSDRFPFRQISSELSIAPGVAYHSIIGCAKPTPSPLDCSDGLVPYSSAHLDGAASELIVRSGHSVQRTPEAILELRRILHLHLQGL